MSPFWLLILGASALDRRSWLINEDTQWYDGMYAEPGCSLTKECARLRSLENFKGSELQLCAQSAAKGCRIVAFPTNMFGQTFDYDCDWLGDDLWPMEYDCGCEFQPPWNQNNIYMTSIEQVRDTFKSVKGTHHMEGGEWIVQLTREVTNRSQFELYTGNWSFTQRPCLTSTSDLYQMKKIDLTDCWETSQQLRLPVDTLMNMNVLISWDKGARLGSDVAFAQNLRLHYDFFMVELQGTGGKLSSDSAVQRFFVGFAIFFSVWFY